MTSPFSQALSICGLSQQEAADFLGVALPTIKAWSSEKNPVPPGVWQVLANLYDTMDEAAETALDLIRKAKSDKVEISYSGEHGKFPSARCALTVEAMIRLRVTLQD